MAQKLTKFLGPNNLKITPIGMMIFLFIINSYMSQHMFQQQQQKLYEPDSLKNYQGHKLTKT